MHVLVGVEEVGRGCMQVLVRVWCGGKGRGLISARRRRCSYEKADVVKREIDDYEEI